MLNNKTKKILENGLSEILPNESVVGEPFWTLMEKGEKSEPGTNGSYITVGDNIIPLFISKKIAMEQLERLGSNGVVRGVSQQHLRFLQGLSEQKLGNMKLCIILLDESQAMVVEPRFIEDYFLI
jgi:hypothetical protein